MTIKKEVNRWGDVECQITISDIHNLPDEELEALAWELEGLVGVKDFITLFINNIYLIIFENVVRNGESVVKVGGRYIKKPPCLSSVCWMSIVKRKIFKSESEQFTKELKPRLRFWINYLISKKRKDKSSNS